MLDDGASEARTAKRARTDRPPASTEVSRWIELARLSQLRLIRTIDIYWQSA